MAAKKIRKSSKKPGKSSAKNAKKPVKKKPSVRAKAPAKKAVRKAASPKRRPAAKAAPKRKPARPAKAVKKKAAPKRPAPARKPAKKAAPARKKPALAKKKPIAKKKPAIAKKAAVARKAAPAPKAAPPKAAARKAEAPAKVVAKKAVIPAPKESARKLRSEAEAPAKRDPKALNGAAKRGQAMAPPPSGKPLRGSSPPASLPEARKSKPGLASGKERPTGKDRPSSGKERPSNRVPPREPAPRIVTLPLPMMAPPKRPSIEERAGSIEGRLAAQADDFRRRYIESLDMSWIYHDSALEGVVYTFEELRAALSGQAPPVTDSSLQPTYDDIRRHKEAIDYVRDFAEKKRLPVTLDVIKKIYLILHPAEGDIKTVKYRKDIPQHRLYFHEYAPPDKIAYKVRQIVDWLNDPETRKTRNGIRIAARAHYDLLRVYPFPVDSGKVSRLFMNLLLMRTGLPAAIIHSTERQRYYEALKGSATTVLQMVQEAVENALSSVEKLLDEHETRKRAFVS
jgi:Fic/DOC family